MASRFFEREFATPQDQEKRQRIVQELQRIRDFGVQVGCGWDRIGRWIFFQRQIFWEISCLPTWRNDPFFEFWIFGMFTPTYLFLDCCFEFSPRKLGK